MSTDALGWLTELASRERSLVVAFRNAAFAVQRSRAEFSDAVDDDLEVVVGPAQCAGALPHFRMMMVTLGQHARREIRFHVPSCPCLGADEVRFLRLHACLCAGAWAEAEDLAGELVDEEAVETLLQHAAAIAMPGSAIDTDQMNRTRFGTPRKSSATRQRLH